MKVFFLVFLVTLYIHVIFNLDMNENSTEVTTTTKYDEFEYDNTMNETDDYTQEDLTASATAIFEVINEFYVKKNLQFDIVIFGEPEQKFYSLIDEIGKRNFSTTIKQHNCSEGNLKLTQSALIFLTNEFHDDLIAKIKLKNEFRNDLKFLIYTDSHHKLWNYSNKKLLLLNDKEREENLVYLNVNFYEMLKFQYFLVDTKDKMKLTTFEWFTETECNSMTYKIINRFDKTSLKWENQLENHEKFKNLHNCMVAVYSYQGVYRNNYDGKLESFEYNMMDILASKLNFIQVRRNLERAEFPFITNDIDPAVHLKLNIKLSTAFLTEYKIFHFTSTFAEESLLVMITPGELYNSYEKILMPFDELTWYFLITTFAAAFGVIFVVSFLPKKIQDYFYGDAVNFPAYNVAGTFFGIGQMKLPSANFSRIILVLFIIFCLIFRTAYQGVMFDMMTKEMRKSSPQTIDELFERNFKVNLLTVDSNFIIISVKFYDVLDASQKLSIQKYDVNDFYKEICSTIFDPKQKFAVNVDQNLHKLITSWCKKSPELLNQKFMTIPMGIAMDKNHFLSEEIEDMMQRTIQAGIPQYWHKYHQWYQHERNHYSDIIDSGPTVLRLEDLSFGFIIWLIACGVAVLGLLGELLTFAIIKIKKLVQVEPIQIKVQCKKTAKVKPIKPKKPKIIQVRQQRSSLDVEVLMKIQQELSKETANSKAIADDKMFDHSVLKKVKNHQELPLFEIQNEIKPSRTCSQKNIKTKESVVSSKEIIFQRRNKTA